MYYCKQVLYSVIIMFVLHYCLSSCWDDIGTKLIMSKSEEIMEDNPESAFLLVDSLLRSGSVKTKYGIMKLELIRAEAMNKTFRLMDTLSVIDEVADYFRSNGTGTERMRALYMQGCMHRDRNNSTKAIRCFNEALSSVDSTDTDYDEQLACRIYAQKAGLLSIERSVQPSIEAWDNAIRLAWKIKDTVGVINYLSYKCGPYYINGMQDSVLAISDAAYKLAVAYGNKEYIAETLGDKILYLIESENFEKAGRLIGYYERYSSIIDSSGSVALGRELYYGYKGKYYEGINEMDSAIMCYRQLLRYGSLLDNKELVCRQLVSFYSKLGISDSVIKYANLYVQVNDSSWRTKQTGELNRMQILYRVDESRQMAMERQKEAMYYRIMFFVGISVSAFLIYLLVVYLNRQRRKSRKIMANLNKDYSEVLIKYVKLQKEVDMLKKDSELYAQEKQKELDKLKGLLANYEFIDSDVESINNGVFDNPVVIQMHRHAAKCTSPSDVEWNNLMTFTQTMLPNFWNTINDVDYDLTDKEKIVAILVKLRFLPSEITVLLNLSSQRVSNMRSFINKKMFRQSGSKSLDFNLRGIN